MTKSNEGSRREDFSENAKNGISQQSLDSTAVKSKETTLAEGEEKLNNKNVETYSADKDALFGCKGKDKF